jgi:hypothetical protein
MRPSGIGSITETSLNYEVYHGFVMTANKRFSDRWMLNGSLTLQDNPDYTRHTTNPTGIEFFNGISTIPQYLVKINGSYAAMWGINIAGNLNYNQGAVRSRRIDGPGSAYGGVNAAGQPTTLSGNSQPYNTLRFEPADAQRQDPTALLDLGIHKVISFRGGRNRIKVMADVFNVFNIGTITGFTTNGNNLSSSSYGAVSSIVPPRVFRVGAQITF